MAYIMDYLTFDRSKQVFSEDPAAQLKGRDRLIKLNSVSLLVAGIFFAFSLSYTVSSNTFINSLAVAGQGAVVIFTLKESILQAVAREIERDKFGIKTEDATTLYGKKDFKKELIEGIEKFKACCLVDKEVA